MAALRPCIGLRASEQNALLPIRVTVHVAARWAFERTAEMPYGGGMSSTHKQIRIPFGTPPALPPFTRSNVQLPGLESGDVAQQGVN